MMKAIPYLNFKGTAEAAMKFYTAALDGEIISMLRFGDNEMPGVTPENSHLIMHGEIRFGDNLLYVSDSFEPSQMVLGNAYTVHLDSYSEEEIRTVFDRLSMNGQVITPLEDTFWGSIFGYLIDQYGIQWSFDYQKSQQA